MFVRIKEAYIIHRTRLMKVAVGYKASLDVFICKVPLEIRGKTKYVGYLWTRMRLELTVRRFLRHWSESFAIGLSSSYSYALPPRLPDAELMSVIEMRLEIARNDFGTGIEGKECYVIGIGDCRQGHFNGTLFCERQLIDVSMQIPEVFINQTHWFWRLK